MRALHVDMIRKKCVLYVVLVIYKSIIYLYYLVTYHSESKNCIPNIALTTPDLNRCMKPYHAVLFLFFRFGRVHRNVDWLITYEIQQEFTAVCPIVPGPNITCIHWKKIMICFPAIQSVFHMKFTQITETQENTNFPIDSVGFWQNRTGKKHMIGTHELKNVTDITNIQNKTQKSNGTNRTKTRTIDGRLDSRY